MDTPRLVVPKSLLHRGGNSWRHLKPLVVVPVLGEFIVEILLCDARITDSRVILEQQRVRRLLAIQLFEPYFWVPGSSPDFVEVLILGSDEINVVLAHWWC